MKIDDPSYRGSIDFFHSIPDEVLIGITLESWDYLEALCVGYTLDYQLMIENKDESNNNRRNMC